MNTAVSVFSNETAKRQMTDINLFDCPSLPSYNKNKKRCVKRIEYVLASLSPPSIFHSYVTKYAE